MANTPSSTTTPSTPTNLLALAVPNRRRLFIQLPGIITHPALRPPVLSEMQPDIDRTIHSLAHKYTDQTCIQLQYDELIAEGHYKLAQLLDKGVLEKQPTRLNFFKFFRTAVANHFRSLVQRFRFTHKRTGHAPPPRHRPGEVPAVQDPEYHKTVELSLDDPDTHLQVPDTSYDQGAEKEFLEDCAALLNPFEKIVWNELAHPCPLTHLLAEIESHRGCMPGKAVVKVFRHEHHAEALGISVELLRQTVLTIKRKIDAHRSMSTEALEETLRKNAIIQQLSGVFGVQIPPNTDEIIIRRLFTIAARDQYQRLTPQLIELLEELGAKPPRVYGDKLSCYGVLYQRTHRKCAMCGLRQACAVEAANAGMGKIALSPHLLGTKSMRIPAIMPEVSKASRSTQEGVDTEIVAHLEDTYERQYRNGQLYYSYRNTKKQNRFLFCLEETTSPIRLRFCNPSSRLSARLSGKRKSWFAPAGLGAQEIIDLIEIHAEEVMSLNVPEEEEDTPVSDGR